MKAIKNFIPATKEESPTVVGQIEMRNVKELKQSPEQARTVFNAEALQELADSIVEHGILQPLVIRPDGTLVAGNRRWLAAKIAKMVEVPCIVRDCDTSLESYLLGAIENLQRADLSPMEEANLYKRMVEEYNMNQTQIAAKLGKPRLRVQRMLALASADQSIQDAITSQALSWSTAQEIENLMSTPEDKAAAVAMVAQGHATREDIRIIAAASPKVVNVESVPVAVSLAATIHAIYGYLGEKSNVAHDDGHKVAFMKTSSSSFNQEVVEAYAHLKFDAGIFEAAKQHVYASILDKHNAEVKVKAQRSAFKAAVKSNAQAVEKESGESMSDVPMDIPVKAAQVASSQDFENELRSRMDAYQVSDSKLEIMRSALRKIVYYGIGSEDSDNIRTEHVIALSKIAQEALEAAFEVA